MNDNDETSDKSLLSVTHTSAVLDNAPVAIYVTDVESWELLYVNHLAKDLLLWRTDRQGSTCYEVAGYDKPCHFCRVGKMSRDKFLVREFYRPVDGRIYQLNGKIIDWDGRAAHIEYIFDITEKKEEEDQARALREELQATFSSVPCGLCVYRYDSRGLIPLFHNPAFYEIMGYSGEHIHDVEQNTNYLGVHPEDVELLKEKVQETIQTDGLLKHTYRVWNDRESRYCWINMTGSVKSQLNGSKLIYCVYSDVSEQVRLENELTEANVKMQQVVNAIPGGVAIYRISDIFETMYFSDGVPELTGYTIEEYNELIKQDAANMIYPEDAAMVAGKVSELIQDQGVADFEFRKRHRNGHIVWVHVQARQIGEQDGCPLIHCVFHNISALKETKLKLDHIINSIPGGIASYQVEGGRFVPTFFSDGVMKLTGHTREEYEEMTRFDAIDIIYEPDKERVIEMAKKALLSGNVLDVSYRMRHKDGSLVWIHLNGRRIGPMSETVQFYAVFTGMSAETRLFQSIADETADGIYVIDRENCDLLYANESRSLFTKGRNCLGQKCFATLHGKDVPCEFCVIKKYEPNGESHEMNVGGTDRHYAAHYREADWNGIPAYVMYVRDVTEEVNTRMEKERLAMYFQTVIKNIPGGISVIRCDDDGSMTPEFISEGFAAMCHMTAEEAQKLYGNNIFAGFHPDDIQSVDEILQDAFDKGEGRCELTGRMKRGDGGYVWVKSSLSMIQSTDGIKRLYSAYTDISKAVEEKEQLKQQYENMLLQHYRSPGPDALIVGHCNITQNKILEILDHTDSDLLETFGYVRQEFFTGLSELIVDDEGKQAFKGKYLNEPALAAFMRNDTEQILDCFVKLPKDDVGRYVRFKVNLVETPDTGDVTGVLTVTDITERTISDRLLHQLSVSSYDLVVDIDIFKDTYTVLTFDKDMGDIPEHQGCHSHSVEYMIREQVVPKDKRHVAEMLNEAYMRQRLEKDGAYSFSYSIVGEKGDILTKSLTISAVDLRLGRICMSRTDITESVREQQGLLNMIAYTFELACFININTSLLTMYTRQTVLENLSPYVSECYDSSVMSFAAQYGVDEDKSEVFGQFELDTMLKRLQEKPSGYDFVFPCQSEDGTRYKQINVLWGDENHRTICMVRADVTDMLMTERQTKKMLEDALEAAKEANRAKSDFLSAMSHDIRTPMNAIMGMTTLALAHMNEKKRVEDCLSTIAISSKHLLSLINDILDMSKIEQSKITLNRMKISLPELVNQLSAIMAPQAQEAGVKLSLSTEGIEHRCFYGDPLRINQILINILSNAVKFTPEGGSADFLVEELPAASQGQNVRYRFTIKDTGIGMPEDFIANIFAPFTRSRSATHIEGTGLGLSITRGLVDLMGGVISVKSQVNKGTTFQVELECEIAPDFKEDYLGEVSLTASGGAKEKMLCGRCFLIAEDNAINAEILCELLSMYGARSVVRTDGAQAVEAFKCSAPGTYDAVLMDIQMPEMNGYDATRAIRRLEREDAGTIPIIAMTANAFAEDIQASMEAGMTAHVAKPIDVTVLQATLTSVLNV